MAIVFWGLHAAALVGMYRIPLWTISWNTRLLCFASWQLAIFGVTIGYHRLWSHRSFTAKKPLRFLLAMMGTLGFQGSIKWWCARHRLHHRYTDDPENDPYSATKGLYFSHMGWLFRKPTYTRLPLVDRSDLDRDPVVQFQHKYYVPLTLVLCFALPSVIACIWGDPWGGLVWGGAVARVMILHTTFVVNSFAHWEGLQLYSDEVTAKGNFLMAMLTGGEGNHNYHVPDSTCPPHAFPYDYRAGPNKWDWDPSKWIIQSLHRYTSLVTSMKTATKEDVAAALSFMSNRHHHPNGHEIFVGGDGIEDDDQGPTDIWDEEQIRHYVDENRRQVVFISQWVVDVTDYLSKHPGGYAVLQPYILRARPLVTSEDTDATKITKQDLTQAEKTPASPLKDASWAFGGGLNNHSRGARNTMRKYRIAHLDSSIKLIS
ncbi:hypothetical protein BS47DRAFT_1488891 [Hydnum rufescens UP504]|uniref:Acyl-CoA desaturase n=1 Tax=Hydnum rufescens UP504 TaxID=1448309 RepID=A0A9P6AKB4_9AGAM|nr:hypothetical protein BS47DRAFT_1488891 [Hydnum rufescens UP504]